MKELLSESINTLRNAGFEANQGESGGREYAIFEDATTVGFVFAYRDSAELIAHWKEDSSSVISRYALALRRADRKAWNTYVVFISSGATDDRALVALSAIEEDLSGTRKIARAGLADRADLQAALLPLLPLQSAPRLEAVNIVAEIRQRTTELPQRAVDAYLASIEDAIVLQILEESE
jgi:hypothetical protein